MRDEGRRLPAAQPQCRCKIRDIAQRHSEDAITVLIAIMGDEAAAPAARIAAANSVLAWSHAGCPADLPVNRGGELKRTAVGVEWSGPLQATGDPN
ncbi:MAG TPA: hypothetical protein VE914_23500 [Candidatus Angelobacter sp.]|nr:hypothetical protein [Candidatus Angelobacter sp.]